jgi:flagellar hook protein FlgE
MMASLFAGVSGLKNHQVKMNVIGNNIANVNTIGFKPGRVNFQEALVQTTKGAGRPSSLMGGTNPQQLGLGMQVGTIDNMFLQGGLETTGQITDMAIQGAGFFILSDGNNNTFYSRAGSFGFDAGSNLVDPATGLFVQGKMADSSGTIPSLATTGNIVLPFGQQDPAKSTEVIRMANNIDVTATDSIATLHSSGASGVSEVSGRVLDGVGGQHDIEITGTQAVNATFTGDTLGNAGDGTNTVTSGVGSTMSLGSLGVTIFDDFGIAVDGGSEQRVSGLTATSSVQDLINAINQISGVTAELVGGEIRIIRDKAGDNLEFAFQTMTAGQVTLHANGGATAGNISGVIFGLNGTTFQSAGGAATTFAATDTFTPSRGFGAAAGPVVTSLELVIDERTGLTTGLSGLGGGGVEIKTDSGGLQATSGDNLVIDTADTLHAASINVFDSQGGKHTLTIEFFKSIVPNRWEWTASTLGVEDITAGKYGYVSFNRDGSLNSFEYFGGADSIIIDPRNGGDQMDVRVNAGSISGFDGLTGFSGQHTASIINQDGYGLGLLDKIAIDESGNISGIFTNGVTRILAQIMLADFNNQAGLVKAGRSLYQESPNSGDAIEGIAGATISGTITSGALESSAVDIAQEFTGMITAQRGFQANARIITTSDQMLDELVNLKR